MVDMNVRPLYDGIVVNRRRILFAKYSRSETKINGAAFLIMREDDILGVLSATA